MVLHFSFRAVPVWFDSVLLLLQEWILVLGYCFAWVSVMVWCFGATAVNLVVFQCCRRESCGVCYRSDSHGAVFLC